MAPRPVLKPLLTLVAPPQPRPAPGGGKSAKDIREEHFERRRKRLIRSFGELSASAQFKRCAKADRVLLRVAMDDMSAAPSYTPRDLFSSNHDVELVAPWRHGYLAEVTADALKRLAKRLSGERLPAAIRVDVSRIEAVSLLAADLVEQDFDALWSRATVLDRDARLFLGSPAPFRAEAAREAVVTELTQTMDYARLAYDDGGLGKAAGESAGLTSGQLAPIIPASTLR